MFVFKIVVKSSAFENKKNILYYGFPMKPLGTKLVGDQEIIKT